MKIFCTPSDHRQGLSHAMHPQSQLWVLLQTLTRLARLLANLNGKHEFVDGLLEGLPSHRNALTVRRDSAVANRDAVAATLRQFDRELKVDSVGAARTNRSRRAVQQCLAGGGTVEKVPRKRYTKLYAVGIILYCNHSVPKPWTLKNWWSQRVLSSWTLSWPVPPAALEPDVSVPTK